MSIRVTPWHKASRARQLIVLMLGVGSLWRGVAYTLPPGPHSPSVKGGAVEVLALHGPLWMLGIAWLVVGAVAVVSAVFRRWVVATALTGAAWLTWGLAYLVAWCVPGWGQGSDWISAGTYLTVAGVILGALLVREAPTIEEG